MSENIKNGSKWAVVYCGEKKATKDFTVTIKPSYMVSRQKATEAMKTIEELNEYDKLQGSGSTGC